MPDEDFIARLCELPGGAGLEARGDTWWMVAPRLDVEAMAREMTALGFRLATMTGLPGDGGETTIIYHYLRGKDSINFKTATRNGAIPSLAPTTRPAAWIERELHDFFAAEFVGHPNLVPLLRPPGLEAGFFRAPEDQP